MKNLYTRALPPVIYLISVMCKFNCDLLFILCVIKWGRYLVFMVYVNAIDYRNLCVI